MKSMFSMTMHISLGLKFLRRCKKYFYCFHKRVVNHSKLLKICSICKNLPSLYEKFGKIRIYIQLYPT